MLDHDSVATGGNGLVEVHEMEVRNRMDPDRRASPSRIEAAGLVVLATGWGWTGGNFSQPDFAIGTQILITGLHVLPCLIAVGLAALYLVAPAPGWARGAVNAFAALSAVALAVIIPLGISNPDPNSFGPHNFADYVPVGLLVVGIGAWSASQIRRSSRAARLVRPQ